MLKLVHLTQLALLLVALPFCVQILCMASFACGLTIGHWQFPVSFVLIGLLGCLSKENRGKLLFCYIACVAFSIFCSSLQVMFSLSDGDAYQRAGEILLANGWNPLLQTESDEILALGDGTFRRWHVSYLPRAAWIYGASLYKCLGFCEVMDSLNVLMPIASTLVVYRRICEWFGLKRCMAIIWTLLLSVSPYTLSSVFGGTIDGALYALVVIGVISLERWVFGGCSVSDAALAALSFTLTAGLKYTGCIFAALTFLMGELTLLIARKYAVALRLSVLGVLTGLLILLANASPYITSTLRHTSPFYPAHTFERGGIKEDLLTGDFDFKNADAALMGWGGRMAFAYLSKTATSAYYKWRYEKESFAPEVRVFDGIEGFGGYYRLLLICALVGLFWVKLKGVRFVIVILLFSLVIQPTKYIGYVRYVSQIYMIPTLVAMSLSVCFKKKWVRPLALIPIVIMCLFLVTPSLKVLPYAWLSSVQNLQILEAAKEDDQPLVQADSLAARTSWVHDSCLQVRVKKTSDLSTETGLRPYGACARRSTYWAKNPIPDFYDYGFADVSYGATKSDAEFTVSRRAGAGRFFIKKFLPSELSQISRRVSQWACLRKKQFVKAWGLDCTK